MPVPDSGIDNEPGPLELLAITNAPFAVPCDVGLNWRFSVVDCPGDSVAGRVSPAAVNPEPDTFAEVIVTGSVPAEVSVRDWVEGEFNGTGPKETELELGVRSEAARLDEVMPWPLR